MIMMNNEQVPSVYMTYTYKFLGVRYHEERLVPTEWELTVNMSGPSVSDANKVEEQTQQSSVIYQKLIYWIESTLDEAVFAPVDTITDVGGFYNSKVMLPYELPSDDVIIRVLHSKLNAIAGDDMIIGDISLYSSDTNVKYNYVHNGEYDLPDQVDFIGNDALYDEPWWERSDGDTFDIPASHEQADELKNARSLLDEFEDHIRETMFGDLSNGLMGEPIPNTPAEIIEVERWKPRKV